MADSDNDCHTVSVVAPIPGNERCTEQSDSDAESLPGMCCPHQCCQNIQSRCPAELQEWQNLRSKLSNDEVNEFIYRLLTVMRVAKSDQKGHRSYMLFGQCVCRNAFRDCIGMGNNKLSKFQRWLRKGYVHPPRDLRHSTPKERTVAWEECDTALQWAYDVLAEYINNDIVHPTDREVDAIVPSDSDRGNRWTNRFSSHCQPSMVSMSGFMVPVLLWGQQLPMQDQRPANGCHRWLSLTSLRSANCR